MNQVLDFVPIWTLILGMDVLISISSTLEGGPRQT